MLAAIYVFFLPLLFKLLALDIAGFALFLHRFQARVVVSQGFQTALFLSNEAFDHPNQFLSASRAVNRVAFNQKIAGLQPIAFLRVVIPREMIAYVEEVGDCAEIRLGLDGRPDLAKRQRLPSDFSELGHYPSVSPPSLKCALRGSRKESPTGGISEYLFCFYSLPAPRLRRE